MREHLGLELLEEEVESLGLLTVVGDADARAGNDLAGVTLGIDLAETSPLTELGGVRDSHHVDAVLGAETSPLTAPRAPEVLSGRDV